MIGFLALLVCFISFIVGMSLPPFSKWHRLVEVGFISSFILAAIQTIILAEVAA